MHLFPNSPTRNPRFIFYRTGLGVLPISEHIAETGAHNALTGQSESSFSSQVDDQLQAEKITGGRKTKTYNQRNVDFLGNYKVQHSEKNLERRDVSEMMRCQS